MDLLVDLKYYYKKVIGIDLGNGLINIRSVYDDGKPYSLTLPNAFIHVDELGQGEAVKALNLDYYNIDGKTYGWGKEIMNQSNIIDTAGYDQRYATEGFKVMAKMVLARAYKDLGIKAEDKVLIVSGVPSDETDTPAEEQLKEAFKGTHKLSINGVNMLFDVSNVETMAQPVATVMSKYLTELGTKGNLEYERMKVAVVDIGGGTIDFDIVQNMRRLNNHKTIAKGFNDVYGDIRRHIRKVHHKANPTNFELLRIILEGEDETGRLLYKPSMRLDAVDIAEPLSEGIYKLVLQIQGAISLYWKDQYDIDELLLVGGSAELFEEYIDSVAKGAVIPENNGDSNVEGYFRTGMMMSLQLANKHQELV